MHLTLLVPGLLLPVEVLENTAYDLTAPTLSRLLGQGERRELEVDWLPAAFGLHTLPAAALRKLGAGRTASGTWICLDPVRWHVAPEGVTLDDPARLDLSEAESAALIEAIRPLFADWGELSASAPGCWELQLKQDIALETQPLPAALHLAIDPNLPGGEAGTAWRRLLAEAQMVLHAHPVNRRREADDRPIVNSLWPWGQGSLPDAIRADFNSVWSADPVVAGLCAHAGMPCLAPPERFQPASGSVLANIETLATPARTLEALAWRDALLAFERDWLTPALAALKRGECKGLRLVGTRLGGAPATVAYELKRSDLLRFWRKPRPLVALA